MRKSHHPVEGEETKKKLTSKVIKLSHEFSTNLEIVHQSSKGRRVIADTDYFNRYLTVIFLSHHVFNTFPLPQRSSWLVICAVLKEANQTVKKATLPQPSSKPSLPIDHPVSRQRSHFPVQWSGTPWPLPRPPPQQPVVQHRLQTWERTQATSTYLWAISHSAAPIRDPALVHLTQHSPCT